LAHGILKHEDEICGQGVSAVSRPAFPPGLGLIRVMALLTPAMPLPFSMPEEMSKCCRGQRTFCCTSAEC
jgi:hypothetical protein